MSEIQGNNTESAVSEITQNSETTPPQKAKTPRRQLSGKKLSLMQFLQMKHTDISDQLSKEFKDCWGEIEMGFDIVMFGASSNGKSSYATQATLQLCPFGKVLHLVYEEGHSKSLRMNLERSKIAQLAREGKMIHGYDIMDNCSFDELMYLLSRKNSPKIIIIDSLQYARFKTEQWLALKAKFVKGKNKKIFLCISHGSKKGPRGKMAIDALFDAQIKVFIQGFIAFTKSRYEGKRNYVIWEEGARKYWGKKYNAMLTKQIF